jgi:excisionase family DNA binding protein
MKGTQKKSEIMTAAEVAKFLKLPKPTIYKMAQTGQIPAFRVGNSWRFQRHKIEIMDIELIEV